MVIAISAALAAPVMCAPDRAVRLLDDARIRPDRVPVTQPNLIPGLARERGNRAVQEAVVALCGDGALPSLAPAEVWESARFNAYSFVLTRTEEDACALRQEAVVVTVGAIPGAPLEYGVRGRLPTSVTPIGTGPDCRVEASWREETVLDGEGTPVRLVKIIDHAGASQSTRIVVRRATPAGWTEQVLLDPAPARLVDGGSGPTVSLSDVGSESWIVAHADRTVTADGCTPEPGQTLWRWRPDPEPGRWVPYEGREALRLLAERGAWRLAGDDGWLLVLAQDNHSDRELIKARMRRMQRRHDDPLVLLESDSLPGLNPGFLVVTPAPWASRGDAEAARADWGRRTGVYVKRAWSALDGCEER